LRERVAVIRSEPTLVGKVAETPKGAKLDPRSVAETPVLKTVAETPEELGEALSSAAIEVSILPSL